MELSIELEVVVLKELLRKPLLKFRLRIKISKMLSRNYQLSLYLTSQRYVCIPMMTKLLLFITLRLMPLCRIRLLLSKERLPRNQLQILWLSTSSIFLLLRPRELKIQHHPLPRNKLSQRPKISKILIMLIRANFNNK